MRKCPSCGGKLRRVHRSMAERLQYLAMYRCAECHCTVPQPRRYLYNRGEFARCPRCGTYRVTRMARPDKIDPFYLTTVGLLKKLCGAGVFHCKFCRIQFYETRRTQAEAQPAGDQPEAEREAEQVTDRASSGE